MNFHVVTLFPDMISQAANTSILGRAIQNQVIQLNITNIRDFSTNTRMRVDDYPYGGGAGMVMEAEPVFRAVRKAKETAGEDARVIYLTPQAKVLDQMTVEELAREKDLVLLCGHYEGIDERVLEEVVTDYISIGDYVLTGGELGALVLMDAVSRFVPGVLHNEESSQFESLQDNLLEYPHYTRPEVWHEKPVPAILLSGDHKKVEEWRHEEAIKRTKERRPDLLEESYSVFVISFGNGVNPEPVQELCAAVSRYGEILDYNRAKLRKTRRRFSKRDLLLFVTDPESLHPETGFPDEVLKNMRGCGNKAVLVMLGTESGKPSAHLPEETAERFAKAGIRLMFVLALPEPAGKDEIAQAALQIRRQTRQEASAGQ